MRFLKFIYYSIFKTYVRLDLKCITYREADEILSQPQTEEFWRIAKEEDTNFNFGYVYLEKVKRKRC